MMRAGIRLIHLLQGGAELEGLLRAHVELVAVEVLYKHARLRLTYTIDARIWRMISTRTHLLVRQSVGHAGELLLHQRGEDLAREEPDPVLDRTAGRDRLADAPLGHVADLERGQRLALHVKDLHADGPDDELHLLAEVPREKDLLVRLRRREARSLSAGQRVAAARRHGAAGAALARGVAALTSIAVKADERSSTSKDGGV